jgi:sugar phosphate isomerase/epimerase
MKLGFITLACPAWDLATICQRAREYGFDGVDIRGLQDAMDVTLRPEFTTELRTTRRLLDEAGIVVSGISSSLQICDGERLATNLEEARRTIPIARELNVAAIRVFGAGDLSAHSRHELAEVGRQTMAAILELPGARDLKWVFETHDNWVSSADCRLLLERIPEAAFGALWDIGHTSRVGGEPPGDTLSRLGGRISYVHIKDAIYEPDHRQAMQDGWRYVPPGKGQLPLQEAVNLLGRRGYDDWMIFEHEKRWHPELEEPTEVLPQFVRWIRSVLQQREPR